MRVKKLPMILALHLKRFKYMDQLHRYTKLSYRVVFPLELRLFNTSGDATNPDRMYDLVAVVVHCGRSVAPFLAKLLFWKRRKDRSGKEWKPRIQLDSFFIFNWFHVVNFVMLVNKMFISYWNVKKQCCAFILKNALEKNENLYENSIG